MRDLVNIIKKEIDDVQAMYRMWFEEPFDNFLAWQPMDLLPRKLRDLTTLKDVPDTDFFKNYLKTLYVSDLQARDGNLRVLETFIDKVELFLNQRLADSGKRVVRRGKTANSGPFYFPIPRRSRLQNRFEGVASPFCREYSALFRDHDRLAAQVHGRSSRGFGIQGWPCFRCGKTREVVGPIVR